MRKLTILVTLTLIFSVASALAEDVTRPLYIKDALDNMRVKDALIPGVDLYFAGDEHPEIIRDFGIFKTSKRTNSFMKNKADSCEWAFASAIVRLQQTALNHRGNAVVEITSNIRDRKKPSNEVYQCMQGAMLVNVAFQGRIVELDKK